MIKVNLQPKVSVEVKEGFKMPVWPAILLLIVVAAGAGSTYWTMQQKKLAAEAEIKRYDFQLRDFQKVITQYESAIEEKDYLKGKRDFVNGISQNQKLWIDFFDKLKERIPKDTWITNFQGERAGIYNIEGNAFSYASIGFFMLQFKSIPAITTVNLNNATSQGSSGKSAVEAIAKQFKLSGNMNLAGASGTTPFPSATRTPVAGAAPSGTPPATTPPTGAR
ncbi:MAG TPA: PilN domain-containing protein [bacterium]|nr:PilN domain-containing protein [bacterium]